MKKSAGSHLLSTLFFMISFLHLRMKRPSLNPFSFENDGRFIFTFHQCNLMRLGQAQGIHLCCSQVRIDVLLPIGRKFRDEREGQAFFYRTKIFLPPAIHAKKSDIGRLVIMNYLFLECMRQYMDTHPLQPCPCVAFCLQRCHESRKARRLVGHLLHSVLYAFLNFVYSCQFG
jgi:hypothetical protein